jgi:peptide/nickel transport system substrate-binding protein
MPRGNAYTDRLRSMLAGTALAVVAFVQPATAQTDVLKVIPHADLKVLDPLQIAAAVTKMHALAVYETLYALDEKLLPQPMMVESTDVSADGLTYRIKLRPGLKFHDGQPVTARDVAPSLARWMARDFVGKKLAEFVASTEVADDRTLVLQLKEPYGLVEFSLSSAPAVTPVIMRAKDAATDPFVAATETIGSGPFRFERGEYVPGSKVVYSRNADYVSRPEPASGLAGARNVKIPRVEWKVIPDAATSAAAIGAGEVDIWDGPLLDLLPTLEKNSEIQFVKVQQLGNFGYVRPNHLYPPFNDARARQALALAVDQEEVMAAAIGDKRWWEPCHAYLICRSVYGTEAGGESYRKPDIARAKQLLAESGYKGEKIVMLGTTELPLVQAMTQITAQQMRAIGLNVDVQMMDWSGMIGRFSKKDAPDKGGWNVFAAYGTSVIWYHPLTNNGTNTACDGSNWAGWPCDEAATRLLNTFLRTRGAEAQGAAATAFHKRLWETVPYAPTGQWYPPTVARKNVSGILPSNFLAFWNITKG